MEAPSNESSADSENGADSDDTKAESIGNTEEEAEEIEDASLKEIPASVRVSAHKMKLKKSKAIPSREELMREMEEEKKSSIVTVEEIKGENEFSYEQVKSKWNEFLEYKRSNGGMETEMMVLKQPWDLDGNCITLHLTNAIQQDFFAKFQSDLVGYLRKELNNKKIEVKHEISEEKEEQMLYTNREKYEHLKSINPVLKDLGDRLGLDPEF